MICAQYNYAKMNAEIVDLGF